MTRRNHHPRLASILGHLPPITRPRALNVGCGTYPSAHTLRRKHPAWALYGLDPDPVALRVARQSDAALRLIHADALHLPGLLRTRFGLILVRHPDLFRSREVWRTIMGRLPALLAPDGVLLVTVYAPAEVDLLHTFRLPAPLPLRDQHLAPVNLAGQDRYAFAWPARSFPSAINAR